MNILQRAMALSLACAGVCPGAFGVDVATSIGLNYKNIDMSFEQDVRIRPVSGNNSQVDGTLQHDMAFDSWQPLLQGSVAVIHGEYYIAFNGEADVMDEGTNVDVNTGRSPGLAYNIASPYSEDVDVERNDLGITLGWRGIENVALFAGYKYGKTDFDGGEASREFVTGGPLVGASYSLVLQRGVLTLGGAFAHMSGTFDEDSSSLVLGQDIDGNANGFSAFVNWSAPLGERLRYVIELRWQRYDFDGSESSVCRSCANGVVNPPEPVHVDKEFSVQETLYGIGASLSYAL